MNYILSPNEDATKDIFEAIDWYESQQYGLGQGC